MLLGRFEFVFYIYLKYFKLLYVLGVLIAELVKISTHSTAWQLRANVTKNQVKLVKFIAFIHIIFWQRLVRKPITAVTSRAF